MSHPSPAEYSKYAYLNYCYSFFKVSMTFQSTDANIVYRFMSYLIATLYIVKSVTNVKQAVYSTTNLHSASIKQEAQLMLTNPRDAFGGQSRSPNIVTFHTLGIVSSCAIVTLSLRRAGFPIFDFEKCRDLEIRVRGHSRSIESGTIL